MRNEAVAVLLVILVAGGLGVGFFAGYSNRQTATTTVSTSTVHTTSLSRSDGDWVFSIRMQNATDPNSQYALSYNLTNISGQPQTVHVVSPLVNPAIYFTNGTLTWLLNPLETNYITTIPSKAGNWSAPLDLSTEGIRGLGAGIYVLSVFPLIGANTASAVAAGDYSIGESLMINTTITIR